MFFVYIASICRLPYESMTQKTFRLSWNAGVVSALYALQACVSLVDSEIVYCCEVFALCIF